MKTIITAAAFVMAASLASAQSSTSTAGSQSQSYVNTQGGNSYSGTAIAPSGNNTAPCVISPSFGVGLGAVGIAGGNPRIDDQCAAREDAAVLRDIARMSPSDPARRATIMHLCMHHVALRASMVALGWCVIGTP